MNDLPRLHAMTGDEWILVSESPDQQGHVSLVVPVVADRLFPEYMVSYVNYLGYGNSTSHETIFRLQSDGFLHGTIEDFPVVLKPTGNIRKYVGGSKHPDFSRSLMELAMDEKDQLFDEKKILIVGCDSKEYNTTLVTIEIPDDRVAAFLEMIKSGNFGVIDARLDRNNE